MAEKSLLDKLKYAAAAPLRGTGLALPYLAFVKARDMNKDASDSVKEASRAGALKYGMEGAKLGAQTGMSVGGPIGAGVGGVVGFSYGAAVGFGLENRAAKGLEGDQKRIESQQEQLAKQAARQQQQLSREASGQAQKKGSIKVPPPPSNIMLEAAGTGSDFDSWHARNF